MSGHSDNSFQATTHMHSYQFGRKRQLASGLSIGYCRKLPLATAYSIRYQEPVLLTPHQEYCQFNQHRTTSTNAYKQYITVRLKLTSHIFDLKSTCLQQTYVLIKRTTGHLQYAFSICVCNTCWKSTNCCKVRM